MKHPGKTEAQRRFLDQIGTGNYSPIAAKTTIDALLKQGLIEEMSPRRMPIRDGGGLTITIRQFQMPIHVHMQWCGAMDALNAEDVPND